jgi:tRNA pseudouridine55 synthase
MDGIIIIDKPKGPTSHDVVAEVKRLLGAKKVGHLGTLDPAATGVLPLVINRATKFAKMLGGDIKIYEFDLVLGRQTDTDDDEGRVVSEMEVPKDVLGRIETLKCAFTGRILQVPPAYSAVKIGGRPLYKNARKGRSVEARPRQVTIEELCVLNDHMDENGRLRVRMRMRSSSGTYVRALCRDLGKAVGSLGHASNIRRLVSGDYKIEDAVGLDAYKKLDMPERMSWIKPLTFKAMS